MQMRSVLRIKRLLAEKLVEAIDIRSKLLLLLLYIILKELNCVY